MTEGGGLSSQKRATVTITPPTPTNLGAAVHGIAGAGAGAICAIFTCPLDVIKTVLQVQKTPPGQRAKYVGTLGTFKTIFVEEGIRGCYKGLGTTLMALAPNWSVYFYAYNSFKQLASKSGFKDGPVMHMFTAMTAAAITDVCVNPLWMIKTRLQTQNIHDSVKYNSTFHAFRKIVREEGPRALFKGLVPQLFGIVHVAVQFPLYEHIKHFFARRGPHERHHLTPLELITAACVSKVCASVVAYPHEVLRSRFQYQHDADPNRYRGVVDALKRIFKEEGMRGFYKGMGANLLRVVPSCAITFTSYEMLLRTMNP